MFARADTQVCPYDFMDENDTVKMVRHDDEIPQRDRWEFVRQFIPCLAPRW
jgi:hypothetical protein